MNGKRSAAVPTLQIENERIIVTEWRFPPFAETTWHTHQYDYIVVPQITGQLLIESDMGETLSNLICGQSYSRKKGIKHNVINNNDYEFVFIEIELK